MKHVALVEELVFVFGPLAPRACHTFHAAVPPPDRRDLRHLFRTWRRKISEGTLRTKKAVELRPRVVDRKFLARVPALAKERRVEGAVEARGLVVGLVSLALAQTICAHFVVVAALLLIRQDGVGRADALKFFFISTFIGVRLQRPFLVRFADLRSVGRRLDAQRRIVVRDTHFVVISWGCLWSYSAAPRPGAALLYAWSLLVRA
mmetsp:Transcript_23119/g.60122  ORF Transcript_23119/g.60122 Transcript_23119/m.60122 type:complete len:205 (+) Transcript_23119:279-893(+)